MWRAGFILTGGNSSRMGRDKALLPWGESTVAEHLARLLQPLVGTVTLIGQPQRYRRLPVPCIADLRPGMGPLGGIETALASTEAALCLVLACDIPAIPGEWLAALCREAERSGALFTGIRDATGSRHPLCAVYRRASLTMVRDALDRGERRVLKVVDRLDPVWIDTTGVLANVNTSEEWQAVCNR